MSHCYCGKILWVDLGTGEIRREEVDPGVYRRVLGGYGLGVKVLLERQPAGADPLGPDNILGFLPGLLTGTPALFSGRYMVVGKSPLTGGWGDANSGGSLSPEIKRCGYDGIFVRGVSERPVYLYIKDETVEIRDASRLWGLDTVETENVLGRELGSGFKIASIGPAGENLALIAAIINDRGRAAARSGLGAVMGSKKLKALALKGSGKVTAASPGLLKKVNMVISAPLKHEFGKTERFVTDIFAQRVLPFLLRRKVFFKPTVRQVMNSLRNYGTGAATAISVEGGDAPVKNWSGVGMFDFPWDRSGKISDRSAAPYEIKKYRCAGCPLGCGALVSVKEGKYRVEEAHRPEYETAAVFGSNILNDNYESIIKLNDLCNRLGLDAISAGAAVAFAMECFEKGLIGPGDCGGLDLRWGDADAAIALVRDIGLRRGLGDILAGGVARAAESIGRGSGEFAMHCGGQELPMHDPKYLPSYGTTYVVDATPGRHTAGAANFVDAGSPPLFGEYNLSKTVKYRYAGKGEAQAYFAKAAQVLNCLGLCQFSAFLGTLPYSEMVNAAAGWDVTDDELLETGERILTMRQLFNLREGIDPGSFTLPDRALGRPPFERGPTSGVTVDLETMRRDFFRAMKWDDSGRPDRNRCAELGISPD
ncbi:MAG: aldehyde ferredoxin oxidoreductase family protein [Peptococcaceae bacterium]|nr:aldehyde ferredoxin oxidoreductase family protein [Peptococcaceae bacterium]